MVRCDLEGVSGIVSYEQAEPGRPEFAFGQKMFMSDLSALIDGLNAGGADEILIYDEHYYGRNIDLDALPKNAAAICGKPPYRAGWAGGLDKSFAGLILLGFHSKSGTGELLNHSYEPDIKDLVLSGVSVGEIGVEAAIAGDYDVPLVMITADSAGVAEAEQLCPGVKSIVVKKSLSVNGGFCFPTELTAARITEAAAKIVKTPPAVKPWKLISPKLEIVFNPGPYASKFQQLFACDGSLALTGQTVTECWAAYWQMKLKTQAALK